MYNNFSNIVDAVTSRIEKEKNKKNLCLLHAVGKVIYVQEKK